MLLRRIAARSLPVVLAGLGLQGSVPPPADATQHRQAIELNRIGVQFALGPCEFVETSAGRECRVVPPILKLGDKAIGRTGEWPANEPGGDRHRMNSGQRGNGIGPESSTVRFAQVTVARTIPRTPDGRPDLQGNWLNNTATPLERSREFADKPVFSEEEAQRFEQRYLVERLQLLVPAKDRDFEVQAAALDIATYEPGHVLPDRRTSLIIDPPDGRVPALTPDGQRRQAARTQRQADHFADGPEDLSNGDRCLAVGNASVPPLLPVFYNNTLQIVQQRDYVAIVSEMIHDVRMIPTVARPHLPAAITQWKGDSIGRWEGDTLVVDTTNFTDRTPFRGSGPKLHLVERLTLRDPNTIVYEFTIDDPETFTRPWSAASVITRTNQQMFEYACHEGNYSMANVLRGARATLKTP